MNINDIWKELKDYVLRSYVSATCSTAVNIAFLAYNLYLGIVYKIVWNTSICGYYFLLILLRGLIFYNERKWHKKPPKELYQSRTKLFQVEMYLLCVMDIALIAPIYYMVKAQRSVRIGKIPAIAIAAYTTYKIVMAIINYRKTRKNENLSLYGLKILNLKDALVSILTLQNTLIMVFGHKSEMMTLGAYTSGAILVLMIGITIMLLRKSRKIRK